VSIKSKTPLELQQLSRTLLTRTANQQELIAGLQAELGASERTCDALRGRVEALETQLRLLSSIPAMPSDSESEGEEEVVLGPPAVGLRDGTGKGGAGATDGVGPTAHDAALTIQMWWRLIRMRRHFDRVRSLAQVRGRTRTVEARAAGQGPELVPAGRASLSGQRHRRTPTWSANIRPLAEVVERRQSVYAPLRRSRSDAPAVPPKTDKAARRTVWLGEEEAAAATASPPAVRTTDNGYVSLAAIRERRSSVVPAGTVDPAPPAAATIGAVAAEDEMEMEVSSSSAASRAAADAAADAHAAAVAAAEMAERAEATGPAAGRATHAKQERIYDEIPTGAGGSGTADAHVVHDAPDHPPTSELERRARLFTLEVGHLGNDSHEVRWRLTHGTSWL